MQVISEWPLTRDLRCSVFLASRDRTGHDLAETDFGMMRRVLAESEPAVWAVSESALPRCRGGLKMALGTLSHPLDRVDIQDSGSTTNVIHTPCS
jgi:hypothetical protein